MTLMINETHNHAVAPAPQVALDGLFAGLAAGTLQAYGLMEVLSLHRVGEANAQRTGFAVPTESLKLVQVPTYGSMVLRNVSAERTLIVPMHIGFFQHGAQNHATSRVLILGPGGTLRADDCFCIQAAQGGLLQEAEQRFVMLPAGLRPTALAHRHAQGFGRLWEAIDGYTRHFGVARGGHLERFLRPFFDRLMPFRHTFEPLPGQVGAAYFIAGELVGVEVGPSTACFHDLFPILALYCYGPSALLAEQHGAVATAPSLDLEGLRDLDDLAQRLNQSRSDQRLARTRQLADVSLQTWNATVEEDRQGLRVVTVDRPGWAGQLVRHERETAYLSVFRTSVLRA